MKERETIVKINPPTKTRCRSRKKGQVERCQWLALYGGGLYSCALFSQMKETKNDQVPRLKICISNEAYLEGRRIADTQ